MLSLWHLLQFFHYNYVQLIPLNSTGVPPRFEYAGHIGRLIFDVSFFIIVVTIGLNVVFGIIVDTFSQLREERVSYTVS